MNIVCDGPGPHVPANGVLGTSSQPISGMRCASVACAPTVDLAQVNAATLQARAQQALTVNATFLALASPTNAQNAAQVQALTKQCNGVIRLLLGVLDSTSGT